MAGRKPVGPKLVRNLDGSERAKERLEVILETVSGTATIDEACERLGIEQAMLFRLRAQALQAGLARLEPRPMGRPPVEASPEAQRIAELEQQLQEEQLQRKALEARLKIAQVLASEDKAAPKKTAERKAMGRKRAKRQGKRKK